MITLKDFISEGILDNVEKNIASGEKIINDVNSVPKLKDFYRQPAGIGVIWYCPIFIQDYLKYIKCTKPQSLQSVHKNVDLSKVDSIYCYCRTTGGRFTVLGIAECDNFIDNSMPLECSRGDFDNISNEKKSVLKLFKLLADNPEKFKKLFEMHNDVCEKEYQDNIGQWRSKSKYVNQTVDDIIKKLE